jgi:hypothetical protein
MESYSECGQDLFVLNLLDIKNGKFLDLGCNLPITINNTYLLELNGWDGISVDIIDYSKEWESRKSKFINRDCFDIDFKSFLPSFYDEKIIDYLSLDMEKVGERYKILEKILDSGYLFKIITIEHDSYLGPEFELNEKVPQREILKNYGYKLICSDVSQKQNPNLYYEDWWVNEKFFDEKILDSWISDKLSCDKIFDKNNIQYIINDETRKWKQW